MAREVYTKEEISLQDEDETTVVLKPLVIAQLKKFHKEYEKINAEFEAARKGEGEALSDAEVMIRLAAVCLEKQLASNFPPGAAGKKKYIEFLEESCDMETLNEIIKVCGGMDFSEPIDPKVWEALMAAEENQEEEDGAA